MNFVSSPNQKSRQMAIRDEVKHLTEELSIIRNQLRLILNLRLIDITNHDDVVLQRLKRQISDIERIIPKLDMLA
jgi:TolB-like protein